MQVGYAVRMAEELADEWVQSPELSRLNDTCAITQYQMLLMTRTNPAAALAGAFRGPSLVESPWLLSITLPACCFGLHPNVPICALRCN